MATTAERAAPEHAPARLLELSGSPDGAAPDRALRVRFGEFLSRVLSTPEPDLEAPPVDEDPDFDRELCDLAAGADLIHEIMNGGPPMGTPAGGPHDLASFFLSLTDDALDSAHRILGYEHHDPIWAAGLHPDAHGERLLRMMRLTDHIDPEGHTFASIRDAVLDAEPTEDPRAGHDSSPAGSA